MKKRLLLAGVFLGGLILVLVWMQGGFHSKVPAGRTVAPAEKAPAVEVFKVEKARTTGEVSASGTVVARETARIGARTAGYVVEIGAEAGHGVKKGQVLARIDSKESREREAQARAALDSARADLTKAEKDLERYKTLYQSQSVAKRELDDAQARYEVALAAQQRAAAAVDEAATQVSYSDVTAPLDGVVADRFVNRGDLVFPGKPLFNVYDPSSVELVASVGEQYAGHLKAGVPVGIRIPSIGLEEKGNIREVVPQRDERSRTITVKAPILDAANCAPGLYGTLTFETAVSETLWIPSGAVTTVGQLETVKVLDEDIIKTRQIKTGRTTGDKVEVLSGLSPGDRVVIGQ